MVDHLITGVCSQGAGLQCSTAEALGRWLEAYPTSSPSVARKLTGEQSSLADPYQIL